MRPASKVSSCEGKIAFVTWEEADKVAERTAREERHTKRKMRFRAYRCRYCHMWHVGATEAAA